MKLNRLFLLFLFLFPTALSANTLCFPHVAFGGGYSTTFVLMNTGTTAISANANFYAQSGSLILTQPVSIPIGGSFRFSIPNVDGPVQVASGILVADPGTVQGVATFDARGGTGVLNTTAGVLGLQPGNAFLLPVDSSASSGTGVAIANTTSTGVSVRLRLLNPDGSQAATLTDPRLNPLGAHKQIASFVTELFPQYANKTFQGTLVIETTSSSTSVLAATALTVKEGLFSALPVIPVTSSSGTGGSGTADVVLSFFLSGGASFQFQGQTFTTVGADPFPTFRNLAPGTYQITGSLPQNGTAIIGFANGGGVLGTGGVLPGSLQSLQGPSGIGTVVSACNVQYVNILPTAQSFKLQFTVTTATNAACQTGN